jgi:hypothetical protein
LERVLRRIFGHMTEEVTGWRKLHNEDLQNVYSSTNIRLIRVIKSRRMRWTGHTPRMNEMRDAYNILV